ncbi:MAG: hypothetical protein LUE12_03620 [Ruminococcus sp.]|nr:hypothetical protein [Ruminococcus sp.]
MVRIDKEAIAKAMQKRVKTRVALRKTACGRVLIDTFPFSVGVESDGAASDRGLVFTISGDAVNDGSFSIDMLEITYPCADKVKSVKRKPELYKKKDGKLVIRCILTEINIPECSDGTSSDREQLFMDSLNSQIVFRFTPHYNGKEESELMLNIYPLANPIEGTVTEWLDATSDKDFFEHGGLAKIMAKEK